MFALGVEFAVHIHMVPPDTGTVPPFVLSVEDTAGPGAGTSIRTALAGKGSGLGLRIVEVLSHAVGELVVEDGATGAVVEMRLPH